MCHYFTTIHTYEGCKLLEKNDLPVEDLSPSTATATASPTPTPKPVTHMARLLRAIAKNPSSGNVANDPSSSVVPEPEAELEQEMHVVNKKTYLQCSNARANKDLADSPDERYCLNASRVQMVDEDLLVEPDNTVPTQLRGVCRVCRAAEEAANRAMDWTEVRPVPDAISTATTSPASIPTSGNLHPTRSNRRSNNARDTVRIHHGRDMPYNQDRSRIYISRNGRKRRHNSLNKM